MKKYYDTPPEEQETIINIAYHEKKAYVYSSRKTQIERLVKKIGEPDQIYYIKKKVSGARWEVDFKDRLRMNAIFSKSVVIGGL